ncbi:MAG: arsenic resistance N-acetyltransferase ArsN2 [Chlorobiaceae bacterium]
MHTETIAELDQILSLLAESGLPVSDISHDHCPLFFGIQSDFCLKAVIGLELFGSVGLIRSLAVSKDCRGQRVGRQLVDFAAYYAAERGVETVFLLTTTAAVFFQQLGYEQVARSDVPQAIRTTSQFSSLCPASSVVLSKRVAIG